MHPLWKDVNLASKVAGWNRFPAVQAELDKLKAATASGNKGGNGQSASTQQERLFQEFQDWKKEREKR